MEEWTLLVCSFAQNAPHRRGAAIFISITKNSAQPNPTSQPTNANCLPLCSALCNDYSFGYCFNSFGISRRRRETLLRHHTHNTTIVRTTCYSCTQAFWLCFRGSARNLWKTILEREFSAHIVYCKEEETIVENMWFVPRLIQFDRHTSCNIISYNSPIVSG